MAKQAAAIGARLQQEVANAAKMLTLEIDKELRKATPVDTGHARRNWIPSIGAPNTTETDSDAAHDAGVVAVLGYKLGTMPLWVANCAPYIRQLNYGHSKQASAGFVERAVDLALQTVRQHFVDKDVDIAPDRIEGE